MNDNSDRICVVCGCGLIDLEPHPEFGGALLCRHCWPAHDSGRLDSPPERWQEPDSRDAKIARLQAEVALLRGLLGECEWKGREPWGRGVRRYCPCCGGLRVEHGGSGHIESCRLAAALKKDHG